MKNLNEITDILLNSQNEDEIDSAFEILFDIIYDEKNGGDLNLINSIFEWMSSPENICKLHYEVLLSTLRLSFTIRSILIEKWNTLLNMTEAELKSRSLDPNLLYRLK